MTHKIELPPELEERLQRGVSERGIEPPEYIVKLLKDALQENDAGEEQQKPVRRKGKELVEYLQREGVIGMWADRDDIEDSPQFARKLREKAERRDWD